MARDPLYDGINCRSLVTQKSALTIGTDEGKVVKISDDKTVALPSAGENFDGVVKVIAASDAAASVQERGYVTVACSGGVSAGWNPLVTDAVNGGVKLNGAPAVGDRYYKVVDTDTSGVITFDLG
jgi:hypothetical protein